MEILVLVAVAILILLPLLASFVMLKFLNWLNMKNVFPLSDKVAREPGQSLREELITHRQELIACLCALPVAVITVCLLLTSSFGMAYKAEIVGWKYGYWIVSAAALTFLVLRTFSLYKKTKLISISLDAQVTVGQELNQLMKLGYSVYHDVQLDSVYIHHLVVGSGGVFAVMALGQARSGSKQNKQIRVSYQDGKLIFPNAKNKKALEQVLEHVALMAIWLKKSTHKQIDIKPVLVIPGWLIEMKIKPRIPVLSVKQIQTYVSRVGSGHLDEIVLDKINSVLR